MKCDYAVTFGNQGLDVDASNKVITAVARRLKESVRGRRRARRGGQRAGTGTLWDSRG